MRNNDEGPERVVPMDDFERLQLHVILRALASQLCVVSARNIEISKRERAGATLSKEDRTIRDFNHVMMTQIEDLIKSTSRDINLERA